MSRLWNLQVVPAWSEGFEIPRLTGSEHSGSVSYRGILQIFRMKTPRLATLRAMSTDTANGQKPVFGFLLLGGVFAGAMVRDVPFANELVRQGFAVHVWWAFDCPEPSALDVRIPLRLLFHQLRYRLRGWL